MIKYYFRKLGKSERGAAIVEFALVVWILIMLLLGILEFGWLFNRWIIVTGAAREGARVAVIDSDNNSDVRLAVSNHTSTFVESPTTHIDRATNSEAVTVTVTADLQPLVRLFLGNSFTLKGEATMRREDIQFN